MTPEVTVVAVVLYDETSTMAPREDGSDEEGEPYISRKWTGTPLDAPMGDVGHLIKRRKGYGR
jgi:hypothetical protein